MKGLIFPIILMLAVFAILAGVDPTTGTFTSDRSYLDREVIPAMEVPAVAVGAVFAGAVLLVLLIHRTAERNGHGGAGNNLATLAFLVGIIAVAMMLLGGAQ